MSSFVECLSVQVLCGTSTVLSFLLTPSPFYISPVVWFVSRSRNKEPALGSASMNTHVLYTFYRLNFLSDWYTLPVCNTFLLFSQVPQTLFKDVIKFSKCVLRQKPGHFFKFLIEMLSPQCCF